MNRALWYHRFGQPEAVLSLESTLLVPPTAGQVQVKMIAAPINPSDVIPITGASTRLGSRAMRGLAGWWLPLTRCLSAWVSAFCRCEATAPGNSG